MDLWEHTPAYMNKIKIGCTNSHAYESNSTVEINARFMYRNKSNKMIWVVQTDQSMSSTLNCMY